LSIVVLIAWEASPCHLRPEADETISSARWIHLDEVGLNPRASTGKQAKLRQGCASPPPPPMPQRMGDIDQRYRYLTNRTTQSRQRGARAAP
jgi:hypothetical protein